MATLYAGLDSFQTMYLAEKNSGSKRTLDPIDQDWQTICNEWVLFERAIAVDDTVSAQGHIDNVIDILNEYDLNVEATAI